MILDPEAIRARARAATPGPWTAKNFPNGFAPMVIGAGMAVAETFDKPTLHDAEFIAHARTDIPALLDEVERLTAAVERVWALVVDWDQHTPLGLVAMSNRTNDLRAALGGVGSDD